MAENKEIAARGNLIELCLSGFQVFKELTRVPLSRLTFLYGPNSAGKSSVEDALLLLHETCLPNAFDVNRETLAPRLCRHWRRNRESLESIEDSMVIGVRAQLPNVLADILMVRLHDDEKPEGRFGRYQPGVLTVSHTKDKSIDVDYRVSFHLKRPKINQQGFFVNREIEIYINGEIAIWLGPKRFGINFSNRYLRGLNSEVIQNRAFGLLKNSWFMSYENGRLEFKGDVGLKPTRQIDEDRLRGGWSNDAFNDSWSTDDDGVRKGAEGPTLVELQATEAIQLLSPLAEIFNIIHGNVIGLLETCLNAIVVPASRTIPSELDLTYFFDKKSHKVGEFRLHGKDFPTYWNTIKSSPSALYSELAMSHQESLRKTTNPTRKEAGRAKFNCIIDRVLSRDLFSDRGYRIGSDYRVLLSPEEFDAIRDSERSVEIGGPANYAHVLRLFLADSSGREFSFDEVGSGLGYVLPVLLAAFHPARLISIVQQPELHLHPALQSSLGDMFIEAVSGEKSKMDYWSDEPWQQRQLIIETHSEHMLLRVLRRVRQTRLGRAEEHLSVTAADVAVVYFDPQPDGTTKVWHLPVSNEGEFLVRWPKGFFTEREADLFEDDDA